MLIRISILVYPDNTTLLPIIEANSLLQKNAWEKPWLIYTLTVDPHGRLITECKGATKVYSKR